jgi:glutamate N-acetyltransferase/amino-acid N-acetyltransferase
MIENGGVTFPKGFKASGVYCGIKKNGKKDLAVVASVVPAIAAGVFTKNLVKGHSLQLTMEHIMRKNPAIRAVVINSGNANACIGERGYGDARTVAEKTASLLCCNPEDILFGSTGVIGVPLNMTAMMNGIDLALPRLSADGGHDAAEAIMTTDLVRKEAAIEFELGGIPCRIGGMAKGSGMIHPNMATMIGILTTDALISRELLDAALRTCIDKTFNRISVDGDTSVCDMVLLLSNGMAANKEITPQSSEYGVFLGALESVCALLAKMIARDGEGATKLVEVIVEGAPSDSDAHKIAEAVSRSPLVKTAIYGSDANWGRILTAAGYSGALFDPGMVDIFIGEVIVCSNGAAVEFDEEAALKTLSAGEITIRLDLKQGNGYDRMWTCDLTHDYITINGSYRT